MRRVSIFQSARSNTTDSHYRHYAILVLPMKQVLIYIAAVAAVTIAVLMAVDQFFKANKKNQLPHIANNALSL